MNGGDYDVVVIGGGPAGSMTAYHLSRSGVRCLVLEARTFPRAKACGGGLQVRAIRYLPIDLSPVLRGSLSQMSLTFGLREGQVRGYPEPIVVTVVRDEFDQHLLRCAQAAGATVIHGVRARAVRLLRNGRASVESNEGVFTADCVVGADGANSVVSPLLNSRSSYFWQTAVYCEVPEESFDKGSGKAESMHVDWGTLPSGYAWAFPKRGSINIGGGGRVAMAREYRGYASRFAREVGLVSANTARDLKFTGHHLPTLTKSTRVAQGNVILVGDAAGFVEPFTGDGISFACHSAQIAAECISSALGSGHRDMAAYSEQIRSTIGAELLTCRLLLGLSVAFPRRVYELFRYNDFVWQTFCRFLRGEESLYRLKREILGPLHFASRIIDALSPRWERKALSSALALCGVKG